MIMCNGHLCNHRGDCKTCDVPKYSNERKDSANNGKQRLSKNVRRSVRR